MVLQKQNQSSVKRSGGVCYYMKNVTLIMTFCTFLTFFFKILHF